MSMNGVRMGRIPKKIKERALKNLSKKLDKSNAQSDLNSSIVECNNEQLFRTVDLIELTLSSSNVPLVNLTENLSALRLPSVFYEISSPLSSNNSDTQSNGEQNQCSTNDGFTVAKYISTINEMTLIDCMFAYEIRYSKNVLQIMKYFASKLRQPFLIYELDFEVTSFFRFIRWKMYNCYIKHTKHLRLLMERMFGLINLGVNQKLLKIRNHNRMILLL